VWSWGSGAWWLLVAGLVAEQEAEGGGWHYSRGC